MLTLWVALGALALLLVMGLFWPYALLRVCMSFLTRSVLWLRTSGVANVPTSGPLLLLGSPQSYLGWLLILAASPRRLRFLVLAGWGRKGLPGWLLRQAGAITVQGDGIEAALAQAREALSRGEAICLPAQGFRTASGEWPLSRVLAELGPCPLVPACLLQPLGSLFAMHGGTFVRKWPPRWPNIVEITFGKNLPAGTSPGEARQALQELSAKAAIARKPRRLPVHRQFVRMAGRNAFRTCWIDSTSPGQDLSYGKACAGAMCLARLLRPLLGDSGTVAVWLPPGRGAALANIALAFLGKASVNLNYTTSPDDIRAALRLCGCRHILTARKFTARLPLDPGAACELVHLDDLLPRVGRWQKILAYLSVLLLPGWFLDRFVLRLGGHGLDDLATVIFSSGSTGEPKGVMLTHSNIAANLESMIQWATLNPCDRILGVLPFFHSFGYTVTLWGPLQIGASAVYHADPRQAKEIGDLCRTHRATVYLTTATFLRFCLRKCGEEDFRSLRLLICGAEKLPPSLASEFRDRFGVLPTEGYGCTELSPVVSTNLVDQACGEVVEIHNRIGTVGAPLPGVAARIVDPETGRVMPFGEEGMLLIGGPNVMAGYLGRPDLTAASLREGWYVTGDIARLDAEGSLTLTGRLSRFAKIAGEMVPLEKVEEALHEAVGAAERICAVTCVPDESRGERVVVLFVAALVSHDVRMWCEALGERGLPNLWVPSHRDFHAVAELPVLGSGKLDLKAVKDLALSASRRQP